MFAVLNIPFTQTYTAPEFIEKEIEYIQTNEEAILLMEQTFIDIPVMTKVAKCESGLRQWVSPGVILEGVVNSDDKGMFQINSFYHEEAATKLGLDIYTAEGNIAYAKLLYEAQGTQPWNASKPCWSM